MSSLRPMFWLLLLLLVPGSLGAQGVGVAPDGRQGRLHVVQQGDTLWDITAHYLGTPWIWPSIWKENDLNNPHLIYPGDLIWITDREMRKVTAEEAAELMRRMQEEDGVPVAPATPTQTLARSASQDDPFAILDEGDQRSDRLMRYASLEASHFVGTEELETAGAIIGNHDEHYWLSQQQRAIVSMGEGEARVGEQFSVYRLRHRVKHPLTGDEMGYFVEPLGRVEITEVHPESSFARVLVAFSEIEPGDRLSPFESPAEEFVPEPSLEEVEGVIVAQHPLRLYSGNGDVVVLDRGRADGIAPGREFRIYRPGKLVLNPLSSAKLAEPDDLIGELFILKSANRTSVALVTRARTEIEPGDRFRAP